MLIKRFNKSMEEDNLNDIFSNAFLIATLADERGLEVFNRLKEKYGSDMNSMTAINAYETQFKEALKNRVAGLDCYLNRSPNESL